MNEQATAPVTDDDDRPAPKRVGGVAAAVIGTGEARTEMADVIGKLVAIQPIAEEVWETEQSPESPVTVCYFLEVTTEDGAYVELGELPIFWGFVRKQLREQATPETPWVLGVITKGRRAYRILPPTPEQLAAGSAAVEAWALAADADDAEDVDA